MASQPKNDKEEKQDEQKAIDFNDLPKTDNFEDNILVTLAALNKEKRSIVCSPLSVKTALAVAMCGAKGDTLKQMLAVLEPKEASNATPEEYAVKRVAELIELGKALQARYNGQKPKLPTVLLANRLFVRNDSKVLKSFAKRTSVDAVDSFDGSKAADATKKVNDWFSRNTKEMIQQVVDETMMSASQLVIGNAIYFAGEFEKPFDVEKTKTNVNFYADESRKEVIGAVTMMNKHDKYGFAQHLHGWEALSIKYAQSDLRLVLPYKAEDTSRPFKLNRLYKMGWHSVEGDLALPKFKLEYDIKLNDVLETMGMKDAFESGKADFSLLTGDKSIRIDTVIHKAIIEVDEKGTVAAAVTAIGTSRSVPSEWTFDHPFPFYIIDTKKHVCLFSGRFEGK